MILPGNPEISINVKRNTRARRMTLRVSQLDGRVTLSLPKRVPEREAIAFAREKEAWIRDQLTRQPERILVGLGDRLPIEGTPCLVTAGQGALRRENNRLLVPEGRAAPGVRVEAYLRQIARDRIVAAVDGYAEQVAKKVRQVTLRDTRSRWGSCSHEGRLMFSWRLILAPPPVLAYVAAHEVAHLVEMNHSPAFWRVVEGIFPDWRVQRDWLRNHGAALHRYRFRR